MKLTTTFWSKEVHTFEYLLFINGKTDEVAFKTNLNNKFETSAFFRKLAKFVKSPTMRKTIDFQTWEKSDYYQFAVLVDGKVTPIKWFDLVINDNLTFSHDIAFDTTLIQSNGNHMPFGHFPMYYYKKNIHLPKYWEFNVKARAYKFMANQALK
jgi:hypothetical protein